MEKIILIIILSLALFLRLYRITEVPPGIDWDEAAVSYNAYSILKTARDEYGQLLPLAFRSFNDYKPGFFVYYLVPFVAVLGLNEFSIRFASALLGVATVVAVYFLVKEWFKDGRKGCNYTSVVALLTSLLLTISPWHLQFSRVAFEPNLALFLIITGLYFLFKSRQKIKFLWPAGVFFTLSFYTYHSARIFVPLLLLAYGYLFRNYYLHKGRTVFKVLLVALLFSLPIVISLLTTSGQARFKNTTFINHPSIIEEINQMRAEHQDELIGQLVHNKLTVYPRHFLNNYFQHFTPEFLFFGSKVNRRLNVDNQGQLYWVELPFLLMGLYFLFGDLKNKNCRFLISWFLISPIPASIGLEIPHSLRLIVAMPTFQIIIAFGMVEFLQKFKDKKPFIVSAVLLAGYLLNILFYLHNYYLHYPRVAGFDWQYGHKQMVAVINKYVSEVDKVVITTKYQQPYIFFLFYNQFNPARYQKEGLINYEFREINWKVDRNIPGILWVGTKEEMLEAENELETIYFPDGNVAFKIIKT